MKRCWLLLICMMVGCGGGSHPTLSILTQSLPPAKVGKGYTAKIEVTGGAAPYRFSAVLPKGLGIDPNTGVISGIPQESGNVAVQVTVTDSQ